MWSTNKLTETVQKLASTSLCELGLPEHCEVEIVTRDRLTFVIVVRANFSLYNHLESLKELVYQKLQNEAVRSRLVLQIAVVPFGEAGDAILASIMLDEIKIPSQMGKYLL
jgi:hypothetical protein